MSSSMSDSETTIEIHSIVFSPDGMAIQFMELPTDVRVQGRAVLQRTLQLHASHSDYREDMAALHRLAVNAVKNGLDDWAESEPYVPDEEHEDDDRGMGE